MPEAPEPGALALELRELFDCLIVERLRGADLLLGGLALRELRAIVLRQVHAPLALVLLASEVGHELREQFAPGLPEAPQLIEHQRAVGGLGDREAPLEGVQHLLDALRGALLLLDQVLETERLVLKAAVGLLQLRAVTEQLEHPVIFIGFGALRAQAEFEKSELSQRLHEKCGGVPPLLRRRCRTPSWLRSDGPAPRSIPATCLTSRCGPSADPVHAPRGCAGPAAAAGCAHRPTAGPRRGGRRGRCARACRGT